MKQLMFSILLVGSFMLTSVITIGQSASYKAGYVITPDGTRKDGLIKNDFKSAASITFQSKDGKKTTYTASEIKEVDIDGVIYISYLSDFFKVEKAGPRVSLYQKVSNAAGRVIYNGSQAVGIDPGTEGSINDHFIKIAGTDKPVLVTKKNFEQVVLANCTGCPKLSEDIKANKVNYEGIEKAVQQYNECG